MSQHLQAFIKAQFKHYIESNLEEGAYDNAEGMRESFEEGVIEAFNEFIQEEVCMKNLLTSHLQEENLEGTEEEKIILDLLK